MSSASSSSSASGVESDSEDSNLDPVAVCDETSQSPERSRSPSTKRSEIPSEFRGAQSWPQIFLVMIVLLQDYKLALGLSVSNGDGALWWQLSRSSSVRSDEDDCMQELRFDSLPVSVDCCANQDTRVSWGRASHIFCRARMWLCFRCWRCLLPIIGESITTSWFTQHAIEASVSTVADKARTKGVEGRYRQFEVSCAHACVRVCVRVNASLRACGRTCMCYTRK